MPVSAPVIHRKLLSISYLRPLAARLRDCATGNGQAAILLAPHFRQVLATDISESQLAQAMKADTIIYSNGSAENSDLADGSVDLVTVAQAYHWFHFEEFERKVRRVARQAATVAVWGYGHFFYRLPAIK